jgi:hypothetical protein
MNKSCMISAKTLGPRCRSLSGTVSPMVGRIFDKIQVSHLIDSLKNPIVVLVLVTLANPLALANDGVVGTSIFAGVRPHAEDWVIDERNQVGQVFVNRSVEWRYDAPYEQVGSQQNLARTFANATSKSGLMFMEHGTHSRLRFPGPSGAQFALGNFAEAVTEDIYTNWKVFYAINSDQDYNRLGLVIGATSYFGSGQLEWIDSRLNVSMQSYGEHWFNEETGGKSSTFARATALWSINGAPMLGESTSAPLPTVSWRASANVDNDTPVTTGGNQISGVDLNSGQVSYFPINSDFGMDINAVFVSFDIAPLVSESFFESRFFALENYFASIEITDSFSDFDNLQLVIGDRQFAVEVGQRIDLSDFDSLGVDSFSLVGDFSSLGRLPRDGLAETYTMGLSFANAGAASVLIAGVPEPSSILLVIFGLILYCIVSRIRGRLIGALS